MYRNTPQDPGMAAATRGATQAQEPATQPATGAPLIFQEVGQHTGPSGPTASPQGDAQGSPSGAAATYASATSPPSSGIGASASDIDSPFAAMRISVAAIQPMEAGALALAAHVATVFLGKTTPGSTTLQDVIRAAGSEEKAFNRFMLSEENRVKMAFKTAGSGAPLKEEQADKAARLLFSLKTQMLLGPSIILLSDEASAENSGLISRLPSDLQMLELVQVLVDSTDNAIKLQDFKVAALHTVFARVLLYVKAMDSVLVSLLYATMATAFASNPMPYSDRVLKALQIVVHLSRMKRVRSEQENRGIVSEFAAHIANAKSAEVVREVFARISGEQITIKQSRALSLMAVGRVSQEGLDEQTKKILLKDDDSLTNSELRHIIEAARRLECEKRR